MAVTFAQDAFAEDAMPAMEIQRSPALAELLRRYRRRRHLTQEELAERAGISAAAVSLLERGQTQAPQKATVQLLSTALDLAPEEAAVFAAAARRSDRTDRERQGDASPSAPDGPRDGPRDGDLPIPLTSLIGRERDEMVLLAMLEQPTTRLLTLTGPAGVGKTRLALQVAAAWRHAGHADVVFVELIPVQEPERVLPAIAQALGVRESDSIPLRDALIRALRERPCVLVLDNFEQVLPAARAVLGLLIACPQIKALVTSRTALHVRGEQCFAVPPLALPGAATLGAIEELRRVPAVALFLERARAAWPDFAITSVAEGQLVAGICARLDGLPLAIELAAARSGHLGLRQLHDRLAAPAVLGVLAEGPQDLADHQRTMRSTIAWSYTLLGAAEQRLFRWLGVFAGGAAAEALADVVGLEDEELLAGLGRLVSASLLQWTDVADTRRYTQLVTLRAYAQEQLQAAGEWEDARRRHAQWALALAEAAEPRLKGPDWEVWQARLEGEVDNLRAALSWAGGHGAVELGLRLGVALVRFWYPFGRPSEGQAWLEDLLALDPGLDRGLDRGLDQESRGDADQTRVRARALVGAAFLAYWQSRFDRAEALAEAGGALGREVGDTLAVAESLRARGEVACEQGRRGCAAELLEEGLAIFRAMPDRWGMAVVLNDLGVLATDAGHYARAQAVLEECLALHRSIGEKNRIAAALSCLGDVATYRGEYERAMALHEESLALARALDSGSLARSLLHLGLTLRERGDLGRARRVLAESLTLHQERGNRGAVAWCLEGLAGVACAQGQADCAARLYGAAQALREVIGFPLPQGRRDPVEQDVASIRATLGDDGLMAAWSAGCATPLEQVVAAVERHEW